MDQSMAYARVQNIQGRDDFIRKIPIVVCNYKFTPYHSSIQFIRLNTPTPILSIIFYNKQTQLFVIISSGELFVNGRRSPPYPHVQNIIKKYQQSKNLLLYKQYCRSFQSEQYILPLQDLCQLNYPGELKPEILFLVYPKNQVYKIANSDNQETKQGISEKLYNTKWSVDDREQLKRFILTFGYGRWKQIQKSSSSCAGKLDCKPKAQLRTFGNAFLKTLSECLLDQQIQLRQFLNSIIEEQPQDPFIIANLSKTLQLADWDPLKTLKQRAVQYSKRLQLLFRIRTFIKRYKQEQLKNMTTKDKTKSTALQLVCWDNLLNFIPISNLFGQRPAVWWGKKHDIDLILGVYKYGYANYDPIKSTLEWNKKENPFFVYEEFPSADSLTRRLKKLIQTIVKIEQNEGKIDFEDEIEQEIDDKGWTDLQKKTLFNYMMENGISIIQDGKLDWQEVKDRVKELLPKQKFEKNVTQIQKMVQRFKWSCHQLISESIRKNNNTKQIKQKQGKKQFSITLSDAQKFTRNMNIMHFVRKSNLNLQQQFFEQLPKRKADLQKGSPGYILSQQYKISDDVDLITLIKKHGFNCTIPQNLKKKGINRQKLIERAQWLCQAFKKFKQKIKPSKQQVKNSNYSKGKKLYQLNHDKNGNVIFPINVNPSLKLLATGSIIPTLNYHSEHNLFPVGYKSIRTYASMFKKGIKCDYTCEILEGDGRPHFRVTSEQDPMNPISRDSSTGCWVFICQKVNDLQDVKKQKVTISGTQRFGLLEKKVTRLLQDLANAQKCQRYKFKYKNPKAEQAQN